MISLLTTRQRTILAACAMGLVSSDVAEHFKLPLDEVRTEIAAAIWHLGARSKLEAVVIALRSHEIDPDAVWYARIDGCMPIWKTDRQSAETARLVMPRYTDRG